MPFSPADPAPYARAVTIPQHLTGAILANMMRCCGAIAARSRGNGYGGTDSIAAFGARVIHCRQTRPKCVGLVAWVESGSRISRGATDLEHKTGPEGCEESLDRPASGFE